MIEMTNRFGSGTLYEIEDLKGMIYPYCTACMSIWAEFLSWANANINRIVRYPIFANNIIVLSCQVTDLAVLNDLRAMKNIMEEKPIARFFIGGCLAHRFDIELPRGVKRLNHIRKDYQKIIHKDLVQYAPPFWVKDFKEKDKELTDGHIFRDMYPLRISVGCNKNCEYCTIRTTRGKAYELETEKLVDEFLAHENVVLIADSPSPKLIKEWCAVAKKYNKPISIRNVEPDVTMNCWDDLLSLAKAGLLKIYHSPVQSMKAEILKDMRRPVKATLDYVSKVRELQLYNVIVATNIIIDYKGMEDFSLEEYEKIFDYVSWNPLWDGKWNLQKAEKRFEEFFLGE